MVVGVILLLYQIIVPTFVYFYRRKLFGWFFSVIIIVLYVRPDFFYLPECLWTRGVYKIVGGLQWALFIQYVWPLISKKSAVERDPNPELDLGLQQDHVYFRVLDIREKVVSLLSLIFGGMMMHRGAMDLWQVFASW